MSVQVVFHQVPAAVRRDVNDVLRLYKSALPTWLHVLNITHSNRPPEDWVGRDRRAPSAVRWRVRHDAAGRPLAAITVSPEYKHATIMVIAEGWNLATTDKERVLVHELAHTHVAPIEKLAHSLLNSYDEAHQMESADPLLNALYEQVRVAMETTVEDVAKSLIAARRAPDAA